MTESKTWQEKHLLKATASLWFDGGMNMEMDNLACVQRACALDCLTLLINE